MKGVSRLEDQREEEVVVVVVVTVVAVLVASNDVVVVFRFSLVYSIISRFVAIRIFFFPPSLFFLPFPFFLFSMVADF